jgi:hypothetical protein
MGSSRTRNSTRSVKSAPKPRRNPTLRPAAMKKRLASRRPAPREIGTAAVDALREHRDGIPVGAPTPASIGTQLRGIVTRLKVVESYVIVARMALDGQDAEQDNEVATLLRRDVGDLLFKQIRALENVAAQCDGGLPSDREDDDKFEDDETEDGDDQEGGQ